MQRTFICLVASLSVALAGCASSYANRPLARISDPSVAIVAKAEVASERAVKAPSPGKKTALGAVTGLVGGAAIGALTGAYLVAGILPPRYGAIPGAIVGATVGTIMGAAIGHSSAKAKTRSLALEKETDDVFNTKRASQLVADRLIAASQRYKGYDLIYPAGGSAEPARMPRLEITVTRFGFEAVESPDPVILALGAAQSNKLLLLGLNLTAQVFPAQAPAASRSRKFRFSAGPYRISQWEQDGAKLLRDAVNQLFDEASDELMFGYFTQYIEFDRPAVGGAGHEGTNESAERAVPLAGFTPLFPPVSLSSTGRRVQSKAVAGDAVTLSWEPFPGTYRPDPRAPSSLFVALPASAIRDVRYDIEVWKLEKSFSAADAWNYTWLPVYRRSGIPESHHTIAQTLCRGCQYAWTVRATFVLNGQTRTTQWSSLALPSTHISMFSGYRVGADATGWGGLDPAYHSNDLSKPWKESPMPQVFYYPLLIAQ